MSCAAARTSHLLFIGALGASLPQAVHAGRSAAAAHRALSGRACLVHAGLRLRGGSARSHRVSAPPGDANCTGLQQYGAERPMLQAYYDVDGTVNFASVYALTCPADDTPNREKQAAWLRGATFRVATCFSRFAEQSCCLFLKIR
jgi:hypothetical protein